jgi:hypothetical protein
MHKYQVWIAGNICFDTLAENEKQAKQYAREWIGKAKLPKDTSICEIDCNYYQDIVKLNKMQRFNASNI